MMKETLVFLLGLVVFFCTFLGIPTTAKEIALRIAGVVLIIIGYLLRRQAFLRSIETEEGERRSDVFVESALKAPPSKFPGESQK